MQHISQQAHLTKVWRKLHNYLRQQPPHLPPGAKLLGIVLARGYARAKRFLAGAVWLIERQYLAVTPLPQQIDGRVGRNPRDPRAKIVGRVIACAAELPQP